MRSIHFIVKKLWFSRDTSPIIAHHGVQWGGCCVEISAGILISAIATEVKESKIQLLEGQLEGLLEGLLIDVPIYGQRVLYLGIATYRL